jgi:hypothetical protein
LKKIKYIVNMKHLKRFNESTQYDGYYIIGWGLSGGFGGIRDYEVIMADSLEEADKEAYQRAIQEYEQYEGMHGLRSVDDIMEEDEVDYDEAEEIYNEEREGWIDYSAEPYSKELEKKVEDNHYENRYKKELE